MARVHLLSAAEGGPSTPEAHRELTSMKELAGLDRIGSHHLVPDPAAADLILFVEHSTDAGAYFQQVRRHPVRRRFRSRCCLFCSTDKLIPFLPGVYASIERSWYRSLWARSGPYLGLGAPEYVPPEDPGRRPRYLFSFVGTPHSAPVRDRIVGLSHPRGLVRDTGRGTGVPLPPGEYAAVMRESAFVLCPRGGGTSSFRLFETMALGRVPVIVADEWTEPTGIDWPSLSVRVPEADVARIPGLLETLEPESAGMGLRARAVWEEWFAPDVLFHRIVNWCLEVQAAAPRRGALLGAYPYVQLLRPYHTLRWAARNAGHGSWRLPPAVYRLAGLPTK